MIWGRRIKSLIVISLVFFALATLYHASHPVTKGPYFFRRLAFINYAMNPDPSLVRPPGRWSSFAFASSHPGGDITATSTGVAAGAAYLATFNQVLDVPLNRLPYFPIIPLSAAASAFTLTRALADRWTAMASASLSLLYFSNLSHFHEYRFGRAAFFVLVLYFAFNVFRAKRRRDMASHAIGLGLAQVALKFTAPGTEVVAVNAVLMMVLLGYLSQRQDAGGFRARLFWPLALFVVILFFVGNPKFYAGVVGGIAHGSGAVTFAPGQSIGEQFARAAESLLAAIIPGHGKSSEFGYTETGPMIAPLLQKVYTFSLLGLLVIYGLVLCYEVLRDREIIPQWAIVFSTGYGMVVNFLLRGLLLGRAGIKGLKISMSTFGIVGASRFLTRRQLFALVCAYMLILSVSFGVSGLTVPGKSYQYDSAEQTASWQATYVPSPAPQFLDFHLYGNLAYYYAEQGTSEFWKKYRFVDWDRSDLQRVLNGTAAKTGAEYVVLDEEMAEYGTKSRSYAKYEPLKPQLNRIQSENSYDRVYDNGIQTIYGVRANATL